tara:strand:+ start:81 stop:227 length:147 start_codon:yes stop_codon:yes gene_type:complete
MIVAILIVAAIVGVFFLIRLFGSWMFRINDLIKQQKETNKLLLEILKK